MVCFTQSRMSLQEVGELAPRRGKCYAPTIPAASAQQGIYIANLPSPAPDTFRFGAMSPAHSEFRTVAANAAPDVAHETDNAVLDATGRVVGEHVLVIGHDTPGIVMELACRGASEIAPLGPNARPEAATADLAVVTGVACIGYAQRTVERVCRTRATPAGSCCEAQRR